MRATKILSFLVLAFISGVISRAGTITGTVTGPDGSPLEGAFVQAQDTKTKITVSVLSDTHGQYRLPALPAADYALRAKAVGYSSAPDRVAKIDPSQNASINFTLQKGAVRWSDLSLYQGRKLLPEGKGKDVLFERCFTCHGFQSRMASTVRDEEGWRDVVQRMRDKMRYALADEMTDQHAADVSVYLHSVFGEKPLLPRSPSDAPAYASLVRPVASEALKIVYVEYEMPGPDRMPFSAAPAKDGLVWMPFFGDANKVAKLDPQTGAVTEFRVPHPSTAAVHSAIAAPDGTVWFAEQGGNKIGKLNPATQKMVEYPDTYLPGKEGLAQGGAKHTLRIDQRGYVWASTGRWGGPLSRFDPETGKLIHIENTHDTYGLAIDAAGNCWFVEYTPNGQIGRVDAKTLKVTKWDIPTPDARPRRIQIDSQGKIWFGEFRAGKIGRFDPATETFKEWALPGPEPTPYALGIDKQNNIWYSSASMDVVGRLNPESGQIVEYPFPHAENTMREFFYDVQAGRMWYGTPANNKVGYFYVAGSN